MPQSVNCPKPTPVVYIDPGTGRGGASRSLYYLVAGLDRSRWRPVIILLKDNPLFDWYVKLGVSCECLTDIPRFSLGERKNWAAFAYFLWRMRDFSTLSKSVARALDGDSGILHVNHENLALTGWLLARRLEIPWNCHIRTTPAPTWSARLVYRFIAQQCSRVIFISQGVESHFRDLAGSKAKENSQIVLNPFTLSTSHKPLASALDPKRLQFRVLTLSNITPDKGIDRQLEVAEVLRRRNETGIIFLICGQPQYRSMNPFKIDYFKFVLAKMREKDLGEFVEFTGHISPPEIALAASDVLIKLGRENTPWGRDLIEAMTAGLPIVTLGDDQSFVANGINGFIDSVYDPEKVADHIIKLRDNAEMRAQMGKANREKAASLFSPEISARAISMLYEELLARSVSGPTTI